MFFGKSTIFWNTPSQIVVENCQHGTFDKGNNTQLTMFLNTPSQMVIENCQDDTFKGCQSGKKSFRMLLMIRT